MGSEHVCLIRNFRVTVARPLIELPAGTLEPAEDPAETAQRELNVSLLFYDAQRRAGTRIPTTSLPS
jgi:hypothetical protein